MEHPERFAQNADGQVTLLSFDPGQVATASGRVYYCHERGICTVEHISLNEPYLARVLLQPIAESSLQVDNFRRLDFNEFSRLGYDLEFEFPEKVSRRPSIRSPDVVVDRDLYQDPDDTGEPLEYYEEDEEKVEGGDFGDPSVSFENLDPISSRRFQFSSVKRGRGRPRSLGVDGIKRKRPSTAARRQTTGGVQARIHQCRFEDCQKIFPTLSKRERHELVHKNLDRYDCPHCEKSMKYEFDLKRHIRWCHSDTPLPAEFKCEQCDKAFVFESHLKIHLTTHSDERPYGCQFCEKAFKLPGDLKRHEKIMHGEETNAEKIPCELCPKTFINNFHLQRHMRVHSEDKPFECNICDRAFKFGFELKKHTKTHDPDYIPPAKKSKTPSKGRPSRVSLLDEDGDPIDLKCTICGWLFKTRGQLSRHLVKHTDERKHLCDDCGKAFKYRSDLCTHKKIHLGVSENYQCEYCPKWFPSSSRMEKHKLSHLDTVRHPCPHCGKAMKYEFDLKRHIRLFHSENPPYTEVQCTICEKKFMFESYLKIHMASHSEERPHICGYCEKAFKLPGDLKRHEKIMHPEQTNAEKLPCTICEKSFFNKFHLQRHMKVHSLEKNFECDTCGEGFKFERELRKHLKSHDPDYQATPATKRRSIKDETTQDATTPDDLDCQVCGVLCKDSSSLKQHMIKHTDERNHLCEECGKTFKYSGDLKKHKKEHLNESHFCDYENCQKSFLTPDKLERHKKLSHNNSERHQCPHCEKTYKNDFDQKKHIRIQHGDTPQVAEFKCDQCEKMFVYESHLKVHAATHSDERPYNCNFCGKSFKLPGDVKRHENIVHPDETDAPKLSCTICEKLFSNKFLLNRHTKTHDPNYKTPEKSTPSSSVKKRSSAISVKLKTPKARKSIKSPEKPKYSCTECEHEFTSKALLGSHMRLAHDANSTSAFVCENCGLSFETKLQLNQHSKFEHNDTSTYICRECGEMFNTDRQLRNHRKTEHELKIDN